MLLTRYVVYVCIVGTASYLMVQELRPFMKEVNFMNIQIRVRGPSQRVGKPLLPEDTGLAALHLKSKKMVLNPLC